MTKVLALLFGLVLAFSACAGEGDESAEPAPAATVTPTPIPPSSSASATPTPLVIPTIVATSTPVPPTPTAADADADTEPTATATETAATATPIPTATPRPIPTTARPTAIVVSPTPKPAVPTATPLPRATAVPTATAPPQGWVNPDCYVAPGAADEPVWWCGGKICALNALHLGCPSTAPLPQYVRVGCRISDRNVVVNEVITLEAWQDPLTAAISFSFDHGDGTIDQRPVSYAYYREPGAYEVRLLWQHAGGTGSTLCGTVTVTRGSPGPTPTPTPTVLPNVHVQCVISKTTVVTGEALRFTAIQNPADAPVSYVFDHGDGTLDPRNPSDAFYAAPGFYDVKVQWTYAGQQGTIPCGTVTVTPNFNASQFIGKTQVEAEAIAATQGLISRIARIDDEWFALTQDYRIDRVNFEIDNGLVTKATLG